MLAEKSPHVCTKCSQNLYELAFQFEIGRLKFEN